MLELLYVNLTKHPRQRLVFAATGLLAVNFNFHVYDILSKKEKISFISILNLPSVPLCNTQ